MTAHPMMRDFYGKSDNMYFFSKEIRHFMHRFLDISMGDEKPE